jgi:hypothetical protein
MCGSHLSRAPCWPALSRPGSSRFWALRRAAGPGGGSRGIFAQQGPRCRSGCGAATNKWGHRLPRWRAPGRALTWGAKVHGLEDAAHRVECCHDVDLQSGRKHRRACLLVRWLLKYTEKLQQLLQPTAGIPCARCLTWPDAGHLPYLAFTGKAQKAPHRPLPGAGAWMRASIVTLSSSVPSGSCRQAGRQEAGNIGQAQAARRSKE